MSSLKKNAMVLFAICSNGMWHHKFGYSALGMMAHFMGTGLPGYEKTGVMPYDTKGSILANQRLEATQLLLKNKNITHLLFIDTDQSFPKKTLSRLVSWDKDIVACNIATKKIPSWPTARDFPLTEGEKAWGNAPVVYTTPEKDSLLQGVARVGCGVILIKREVFEKTGANVWGQPWIETWQRYQGEDWSFCEAAVKAGFKIHIDHGLSLHIGHWGEFNYTHEFVGEVLPSEPPNGNQEDEVQEHQV